MYVIGFCQVIKIKILGMINSTFLVLVTNTKYLVVRVRCITFCNIHGSMYCNTKKMINSF